MNPQQPSREQIEQRITALLLGELPAAEAELLRYAIAQDAGLKKLRDDLAVTLALVREVEKNPAPEPSAKSAPLKLSQARREKLLNHFKTPRQKPSFWLQPIRIRPTETLIVSALLILIFAGIAAISIPNFVKARSTSQSSAVINNLRQIDGAKQQWALEHNKSDSDAPTPNDLKPYLKEMPKPVMGETYVLGKVSESPSANVSGGKVQRLDVQPQAPTVDAVTASLAANSSVPPKATPEQTLTVAREPVLAPPPAEIVLPQTEMTSEMAKQSPPPQTSVRVTAGTTVIPSSAQSAAGAVFSTGIVGYTAITNSVSLTEAPSSLPVAGTLPTLAMTEKFQSDTEELQAAPKDADHRWSLPAQPGSGSSSLNSAPSVNDANGARFAFDSLATRSQPAVKPGTTAGTLGMNSEKELKEINGQVAQDQSGTGTDVNLAMAMPESGYQDRLITGGLRNRIGGISGSGGGGAGGNTGTDKYYRNLSDDGMAANIPMPATQPLLNGTLQTTGVGNTSAENELSASEKTVQTQYRMADHGSVNKTPVLGDVPAAGTVFEGRHSKLSVGTGVSASSLPVPLSRNTDGTLALNSTNAFTGGTTLNAGELAVDDDGGHLGFTTTFGALVKTTDVKKDTAGTGEYETAQQKLASANTFYNLLNAKVESERLDLQVPKSSMVQIVDAATPGQSQNFWQRITGQVESKARIKVETDVNDITAFSGTPTASMSAYDPYFIQTSFEVMHSDAVLGKVVDKLKLDEAWSKKNGGEKLSRKEAIAMLRSRLDLESVKNTKLLEIGAKSDNPREAAQIANAVAEAYRDYRLETRAELTANGVKEMERQLLEKRREIENLQAEVERLKPSENSDVADKPLPKRVPGAPVPQPEILCRENNFSTFSLNVSDVSFKLAAASLGKGQLPDASSIRSEEFINAFNYRDPEAAPGQPLAFTSERARYPFAHNRDLLRFSVKTAASGRQAGRPLNIVLLLDTSGSMERADRVAIVREALRVLASQLQASDTVSVVTFARIARLWADGVPGNKAGEALDRVGGITPEGGTNLEEAMRLAYEAAHRHYLANGINRVVLLTDGAANLGNVEPAALKEKVEAQRRQGIALDCFGIGWEDFNDDLLAELSGNGDGRYAFINSPEEAGSEFAAKLAGALQVAAQDVKVQVEFNPQRVISWRQIGYATHQLTKEQFRDNSVIAAEIAAQEAGNALYTVETKPDGIGPVATVYVRYRVPGTQDVREHSWAVDYDGAPPALEQSSPAMRLAATAAAFSEWLAASPFAQEVTPDELLKEFGGVPQIYGADQRPAQLETMIREAKSIAGK